jgi:hypothetical protein
MGQIGSRVHWEHCIYGANRPTQVEDRVDVRLRSSVRLYGLMFHDVLGEFQAFNSILL